jgi:hypothetical protein
MLKGLQHQDTKDTKKTFLRMQKKMAWWLGGLVMKT